VLLLKPELAQGIDTQPLLLAAVQTAIKLEHSTIPPYLYALYSIVPGKNVEIARLLHSVVVEEMSHMALACNLLNALGGSPAIDDPAFIPTYPGPLPGAVEHGLVVPMKPFSLDLVKDVFMEIEEPEDPLEFRPAAAPQPRLTIGEFYAAIRDQMETASFSGAPDLQVTHPLLPEITKVTDAASAIDAINTIIEQGEGTSASPLDRDRAELAHYYRFAEIANGRTLVKHKHIPPGTPPDQQWSYADPPIPFDPDGVRPVIENPAYGSYEGHPYARAMSNNFSYDYTALLRSLHAAFNGAGGALDASLGLMESLKQQAYALMKIELNDGVVAGPIFAYSPVNG
jgi:hypothetical protein